MGSPEDESGRLVVESPQRVVAIEKAFAVGKFAVTVGQLAAFIADSGYRANRSSRGRPVRLGFFHWEPTAVVRRGVNGADRRDKPLT